MSGEEYISAEVGIGPLESGSNAMSRREFLGLVAAEGVAREESEVSRRTILKGLGATSVLTFLQGVSALQVVKERTTQETFVAVSDDVCTAVDDILCYLERDQLDVPAITETVPQPPATMPPVASLPTEQLPPPPTPDTLPPETLPPSPPTAEQPAAAVVVEARSAKAEDGRFMSYEEFAQNAELMITNIPTLDTLHALFPNSPMYHYVEEQKQHVETLHQTINLTPEGYYNLQVDLSRVTAFADLPSYQRRINPRMYILHWTGADFPTVDNLISFMRPLSVYDYTGPDIVAGIAEISYQLFEDPFRQPSHGLAINEISQGHEVYTGPYDGVHSPVFSLTSARLERFCYRGVQFLRRPEINLPINTTTVLGHMAADLIFWNPFYDPYSGTFHEVPGLRGPTIRKPDPPQDVMQMLVPKMMALDLALGPR